MLPLLCALDCHRAMFCALNLCSMSYTRAPACSCSYPGVFSGAVLELARGKDFKSAVEENALAGGDNCSRAIFMGACLAAEQGEAAIPAEWKTKTEFYVKAEALLDQLQK